MTPTDASFFVTGGTLPKDAPSYVSRRADTELLQGLRDGEFCYVLTSRQMGKSSLMVRAAARLEAEGVAVAVVDLTALGQTLTLEQWYGGLLRRIGRQLGLENELESFWTDRGAMGPLERWVAAIREVVLKWRPGKVVIFIDEIDVVRSLGFSTDEFFAAIRECHNDRVREPEYARLTFCLLGVAAPSDLIRDTQMTPFNIGKRIELNDFSEAEASTLAKGLSADGRPGALMLKRILYWTSGHPYLTQKLCRDTVEDLSIRTPAGLDRICDSRFFSNHGRQDDDNLLFVRERLLRSDSDLAGLLELYTRIHSRRGAPDDDTNPLITKLRLSGVVRTERGRVRVRNRIYEKAFDGNWASVNMPDAERRRQQAAYRRGVARTSAVAVLIFSMMGVMLNVVVREKRRADRRERETRHLLYVTSLGSAFAALEKHNTSRAQLLVDSIRPEGKQDFAWSYLWSRCHRNLRRLECSHNVVFDVAYSPDERALAAAAADGTVRIWEPSSGQLLRTLVGHRGQVVSLKFGPNADWLVTAGVHGQIIFWDWRSGGRTHILPTGERFMFSLAVSPDGRTLVSGHPDGKFIVWDTATWSLRRILKGCPGDISTIVFSPDGRQVAVGGGPAGLQLWKTAGWLCESLSSTLLRSAVSAAYSPDGEWLALALRSGGISTWNRKDHRTRQLTQQPKFSCLAYSWDGRKLAAGSWDTAIRVWHLDGKDPPEVFDGHIGAVNAVAFCPNRDVFASASFDATVRTWRDDFMQSFVRLKEKDANLPRLAFSGEGALMASVDFDQRVAVWDAFNGAPIFAIEALGPQQGGSRPLNVGFSPNGGQLFAVSSGRTIRAYDALTGQKIENFQAADSSLQSLALSPNGQTFAGGSQNGEVVLWDRATPERLIRLRGHTQAVRTLAFSPNGKELVTGSWDGTARIWDVGARGLIRVLPGQMVDVNSVAISPDGKKVATGSHMGQVRLWDADTGMELFTLTAGEADINGLAFSGDGSILIAADANGLITRWYTKPGNSGRATGSSIQRALAKGSAQRR